MQPNDVELVRVFTREPGQSVADFTAETTKDFEIVLDAEAGSALHGTGGKYKFSFVVQDLTTLTIFYGDELEGTFGDAKWTDWRTQVVFTIPGGELVPELDEHVMQVEAVLLTGGVGPTVAPDASFCTSPKFLVHLP